MRGHIYVDCTVDPPRISGEAHFDLADFPTKQVASPLQAREIVRGLFAYRHPM